MKDRCTIKLLFYMLFSASLASTYPVNQYNGHYHHPSSLLPNPDSLPNNNGEVISIRITSSVAVERGKSKDHGHHHHSVSNNRNNKMPMIHLTTGGTTVSATDKITGSTNEDLYSASASEKHAVTALPYALAGANIEYLKQLQSKKDSKSIRHDEPIHPFQLAISGHNNKTVNDDPEAQASITTGVNVDNRQNPSVYEDEYEDDVPRARSIASFPHRRNHFSGDFKSLQSNNNSTEDSKTSPNVTAVNFNVVHDPPRSQQVFSEPAKVYGEPSKVYSEPAKIYSMPEQFFSEPARIYGEPAKVYSEPAKIYSEPAKIYSQPAKVYSEPAKFYSQPASLFLHNDRNPSPPLWEAPAANPSSSEPEIATESGARTNDQLSLPNTEPPSRAGDGPYRAGQERTPEQNYEVDESISVMTNGRTHGVQETTTEKGKVGYVVEGRKYRKYRVEERTPDGFIVGEYGVLSHDGGQLRGVRYTADGDASPRLIYDALLKFLQLK